MIATEPALHGTAEIAAISNDPKHLLQISMAALGVSEVCCFFLIAPLLHPRHAAIYHWSGTASSFFLPVFLDLLLAWIFVVMLLLCVHTRRLPRITVWLGFLLLAPAIVSYNWDLLLNGAASPVTLRLLLGALVIGALPMCGWRLPAKRLDQLSDFVSTVMVFFGISGVLVLGQLASLGWQARGLNHGSELPASKARPLAPSHGRRIIWIIFDELSYEQVYERRFPNLNLPAFDALAAQSNVLTETAPAGVFTDVVLPSLMSGRPIDVVHSSPSGALSIHNPQSGTWQAFDPRDTVFDDALRSGYGTRVAGWYIPYCRLLPGELDRCSWSYDIPVKNRMSSQRGLAGNMLAPFVAAASEWMPARWLAGFSRLQAYSRYGAEMHIEDFETISAAADAALRDPSAGFVLLHFPVPHLGGIYNRATGQFTTGTSTYLDNLALADTCLAHLRAVLEQMGQWDSSDVVVMGDHSWRMKQLVADAPTLQGEELRASRGGRYDPRPVYIVKLAGQRTGQRLDTPFAAVHTRTLLDAILRGKLPTPAEFNAEIQRLHRDEKLPGQNP